MRDSNTQPAGADNGVAGFSMKKTLIIAGCVCLLLVAVGVVIAIALLARGGGSAESSEQVAPATALPIATALPAATDRPGVPVESPEQVASELPDAPANAVPTVGGGFGRRSKTAPPAATDAPEAPTVEPAAMPWPEAVRLHEQNQGDDPTGLYTDALMRLKPATSPARTCRRRSTPPTPSPPFALWPTLGTTAIGGSMRRIATKRWPGGWRNAWRMGGRAGISATAPTTWTGPVPTDQLTRRCIRQGKGRCVNVLALIQPEAAASPDAKRAAFQRMMRDARPVGVRVNGVFTQDVRDSGREQIERPVHFVITD